MAMLVNRSPIPDEARDALMAELKYPEYPPTRGIDADDLTPEGVKMLRRKAFRVEGRPADGITLRNTRQGLAWCAFRLY